MEDKAQLTCPKCGGITEKPIREGVCEAMYDCASCGERVTAKECCCVICEYSDKRCSVTTKEAK